MFFLNFNIYNPWSKRWDSGFCYSKLISKHKCFEFQFMKTNDIINIEIRYSVKRDHAGLNLQFGLFGFTAAFQIYDTRHWDYENSTWETHNDIT